MHRRLAPLALVVVAACTSTRDAAPVAKQTAHPATASCRILGTWVWYYAIELPKADEVERDEPSRARTPQQLVAEQSATAAANDYRGSETFLADGTWVGKTTGGDELRVPWELVSDEGERIVVTIEMPYADRPKGSKEFIRYPEWRREYIVESPDVLRDTIGVHDGMQFVRVRKPD